MTGTVLHSLASVTPPAEMANVASFSGISGLKDRKKTNIQELTGPKNFSEMNKQLHRLNIYIVLKHPIVLFNPNASYFLYMLI